MSVLKTTNPDKKAIDNVLIWDNAIIPNRHPVARIVPSIDSCLCYLIENMMMKAMELVRLYKKVST